jgi:hypothetical protein
MATTLKKFDMDAYTKRRMRELRGERVYSEDPGGEIARYIQRRMREMRQTDEAQRELDKSPLGCYTIGTMGDRDGET